MPQASSPRQPAKLDWNVPWRRHLREWNELFRYGLAIPQWIRFCWTAMGLLFLSVLRQPLCSAVIVAVPATLLALAYWRIPELAELEFDFWLLFLKRCGAALVLFVNFGSILVVLACLQELIPGHAAIYDNRTEYFRSGSCSVPKRFEHDRVSEALVTIENTERDVEYTLWLLDEDGAHAIPLHSNVDPDLLRDLLPCPLSVDDRRAARPTTVFQRG